MQARRHGISLRNILSPRLAPALVHHLMAPAPRPQTSGYTSIIRSKSHCHVEPVFIEAVQVLSDEVCDGDPMNAGLGGQDHAAHPSQLWHHRRQQLLCHTDRRGARATGAPRQARPALQCRGRNRALLLRSPGLTEPWPAAGGVGEGGGRPQHGRRHVPVALHAGGGNGARGPSPRCTTPCICQPAATAPATPQPATGLQPRHLRDLHPVQPYPSRQQLDV